MKPLGMLTRRLVPTVCSSELRMARQALNHHLATVEGWMSANKRSLNPGKTEALCASAAHVQGIVQLPVADSKGRNRYIAWGCAGSIFVTQGTDGTSSYGCCLSLIKFLYHLSSEDHRAVCNMKTHKKHTITTKGNDNLDTQLQRP